MAERTLNDICIIAKQAGLILREGYEKSHDIKQKTRQDDLVTEMDKKSEDFILERLGTLYPDDMIVTEETGTHTGDAEHVWYIDPCDGTMNYAHGLPLFAVSIGYAYKGELTMGAVYDPMRDECFYAEKGKGAWLNGRPIHASDHTELKDALFSTGFSISTMEKKGINNFPAFEHFMRISAGVRRLGVAALEISYVACGRLDGYWSIKLCAWDVAAGFVIAKEAGIRITALDGESEAFKAPYYDFIMARPELHEKLTAELKPFKLIL